MKYWLIKSDPDSFSLDDLARAPRRTTSWDGVRNFQARNMLRDDMHKGDRAFFYHSNCPQPGIVGIVEVTRNGYVDVTAFDPRDHHYDPRSTREKPLWYCVDVVLRQRFPQPVTLQQLRAQPALCSLMILRRGNRLSVTPVNAQHWRHIVTLATHV